MPCVLPVIGLKILSFVQQAGHNRRKAFMLNVWYSAGLLAVFFILASLAVGPQHLGWGELSEAWFTITLTAVVFVMALSFMGVWEVPLPTFLGRGKAGELAAQEGAVGAFFKGGLTTFLATPCSAPSWPRPGLGRRPTSLADLCRFSFHRPGHGQSVSAGRARFPNCCGSCPSRALDGDLQNFMGFVLMGTVVYLLAVLKPDYVVPTVGLLFGLSFMCWWVGRIAPRGRFRVKLRAWALGAVLSASLDRDVPGLDLGRIRLSGLATLMAKQVRTGSTAAKGDGLGIVGPKTVLVDFTADWCPTALL